MTHLLTETDLGPDIPADLLRPPLPACYIRFNDEMQRMIAPPVMDFHYQRVEGVYVFVSLRKDQRILGLVVIYVMSTSPDFLGIMETEMMVDDEQLPVTELITRLQKEPDKQAIQAHSESLIRLCTKVCMYWNVEQAQRVEEHPYANAMRQLDRIAPKKSAKLRRQARKLYDRVLLGPMALPVHLHGVRGNVTPHWRRGHFRMQPHGPQMALRKIIFIAPTLVRPDRLATV